MPCMDCPGGGRECGPDPSTLCELGGVSLTEVGEVCHDVYVRKNPGTGKCQAQIDHDWGKGSEATKYEFCVKVYVREDSKGNCVVRYELVTSG